MLLKQEQPWNIVRNMATVGAAKTVLAPQQQWNAQQITVVAVIDTQTGEQLQDRQIALDEVQQAVHGVGANFQRVPVNFLLSIKINLTRIVNILV